MLWESCAGVVFILDTEKLLMVWWRMVFGMSTMMFQWASALKFVQTITKSPENSRCVCTEDARRNAFSFLYISLIAVASVFFLKVNTFFRMLAPCLVQQLVKNLWSWGQDDYAIESYERALAAHRSGAFRWEIIPVSYSTITTSIPRVEKLSLSSKCPYVSVIRVVLTQGFNPDCMGTPRLRHPRLE